MEQGVLVVLLLVCAYTDLRHRKIYNMVLLPVVLFGLFFNLWYGGVDGLRDALLGLFFGGGLLLVPYLLGGMGAGDVKLLATVGAVGGVMFVLQVFILGALFGGLMAVVAALKQGRLLMTIVRAANPRLAGSFRHQTDAVTIPYGLAIAVGGFIAMFLR